MTMGDREEKPQLQRRGGKRVSGPTSPISPSLSKRNERPVRSPDQNYPIDHSSTTDASADRPSIDLNFPSPLFETSLFSSTLSIDEGPRFDTAHKASVEKSDKNKAAEAWDGPQRTGFGGRVGESRQTQNARPNFPMETTSRSPQAIGGYRDRLEHGSHFEGRDRYLDNPSSNARNYSTTSLSTDRSASDENITAKNATTKKSRLNLLNPMSLLARRRSSQTTKPEDLNLNVTPLQVPAIPDNFDPSIRGSFVHDFSTPRTRRTPFDNSPRRETFWSPTNPRRPSDHGLAGIQHGNSSSPALHSPMFKEHFQDDKNAIQPSQTNYLHNASNSRPMFDAPALGNLPSFAQKLPVVLPEPQKDEAIEEDELNIPHPEEPPPPPPPPPPKRTPSPHLDAHPIAALPKHMTSVSSRFSFQIAGQDSSAQEKLLEEKHKEQFGQEPEIQHNANEDVDEYDNYDFDADDDFEESVPVLNADLYDDDGFDPGEMSIRNIEIQSSQLQSDLTEPALQNFHFTPSSMAFSPATTHDVSEPTPRDNQGFVIGLANTKDSPADPQSEQTHGGATHLIVPPLFLEGLRINTTDETAEQSEGDDRQDVHNAFDDADLYFDDGEFDLDHVEGDGHFDESLLDEPGRIRDIPAENERRYEEALKRSVPGEHITTVGVNATRLSRDTSSSSDFVNLRGGDEDGFLADQHQGFEHTLPSKTSVLTEDNLAAYHEALAEAANYAAANGKFNRQVSFSSDRSENLASFDPSDGQIPVRSDMQYYSNRNNESETMEDYEEFGFDDEGLDDDLMIAEANAEALENDDEGFYGQEFGFYARAYGKEGSDFVNGGYFAIRGSNGVKRSHSGKANFQEPSLTPITERSEWSTRNSVASLPLHSGFPGAAHNLPSPGTSINQLLESPSFEDDMSLNALLRLRRGTFGGSSTSINSLGERSMPGSSPLAHVSNYSFPGTDNHARKLSVSNSISILESEEDEEAEPEQLTLTQNTPRKKFPGASPSTPQGQMAHLAVTEPVQTSKKGHHRRSSSGADSVSYVRDKDGQWVLERRRTGDDGEQEIVEREYLAGARI